MGSTFTKSTLPLPPLLYPSREKKTQTWMSGLLKENKIRSIGPRLYTSVPSQDVEITVRQNWAEIIAHLFPEALLGYRSALEFRPTKQGEVFLIGSTNRTISYPGLKLSFVRGPGVLETDPLILGIRSSSMARAILDNLSSTKRTLHRSLTVEEIEGRLETLLEARGESDLNKLRDQARNISKKIDREKEFRKLDSIIGGLLGTRSGADLRSKSAIARSQNKPYDRIALEKLDILFSHLMTAPSPILKESIQGNDHFRHKAFFESYFSNYIEGTTFEIEEAEEIVFQNRIPEQRPKDGHDVLSYFKTVSNPNELKITPNTPEDLEALLKRRHKILMNARPENAPGIFKTRPNRAGDTHFTDPELVPGTLEKGFERYLSLEKGLSRAIFMMFLIAEVHPFLDGNGRVARIMMNAELFSEKLSTIIIPTVYREDYLLSLRSLSRRNRPDQLVKMLTRAQRFSTLDFSKYASVLKSLEIKNWFKEPSEAMLIE